MAREILVDEDACISCELCINNLPTVFRYAASGKAECYDINGATEDEIQSQAIDACPVSCIRWQP